MSSARRTIRYPSGATEFRPFEEQPEVGDILMCNGDNWVVEEVDEAVVSLRHQPGTEPGVTETVEPEVTDGTTPSSTGPSTQTASRILPGI